MDLRKLTHKDTRDEILCESYLIENIDSIEQLLQVYNTYKQNNTGKTVIITLDDLGQAEYTSGHAVRLFNLDTTQGYDLSQLDKECFEDQQHLGYLSTASEFFIRKENFLKQAKLVDFKTVCDKNLTVDVDEISIMQSINQDPLNYLDQEVILKIVPVENCYQGICGFPNGYFSSDLNPFENYALAKYFNEKYGFELFGIGASLLGFIAKQKLQESQIQELKTDLSKLYNAKESDFNEFVDIIKNNDCFFIKYIEYLEQ